MLNVFSCELVYQLCYALRSHKLTHSHTNSHTLTHTHTNTHTNSQSLTQTHTHCISHPKMSDLFPLNDKSGLEVREREKYKVFHANTERYKVSTVLYLQRLLNKDNRENIKTSSPG